MNKRIAAKELSAYIDGEARNAGKVRDAIEHSEDIARRHTALAKVSAHLKALPQPELRPGFAQRVVAHVRDEMDQRHQAVPWRIPVGATLAAAAVFLVVFATTSINPSVNDRSGSVAPQQSQPAQPTNAIPDEDALLAELERRVTGDASVQAFVAARFDNPPEPVDLYTEDLVVALFASEDFARAGQTFAAHGADFRPALRQLDEQQTTVFKELLAASVSEGLEG